VLSNAGRLRVRLAQQAVGDDKGDVLTGDAHLLKAVAHPAQLLGHKSEAGIIKQRLLNATEEAEGRQRRRFAQFA